MSRLTWGLGWGKWEVYCGVEGRDVAEGKCANDVSVAKDVDEVERVRPRSECCLLCGAGLMGVIGIVDTERVDEKEVRRFGDCGSKMVLMLVGELDESGGDDDICAADDPDVTVRGAKGAGFFVDPSATPCAYELPRIRG